ncbi:MAG: hypothetical protein AAFX06_24830 [Planctomycetota bacterium]
MDRWTISLAFAFVYLFACAKLTSWFIYQFAWADAIGEDSTGFRPTLAAVRRFQFLPIHATVVFLSWPVSWNSIQGLHLPACVLITVVAFGAIFRLGAVDLRRFFFFDRLVVGALAAGACWTPVLIYPSLLASCCLQYIVSRSPLGPGYSNLLGFEFVRGSSGAVVAFVCVEGTMQWLGLTTEATTSLFLIVLLALQGSTYVNHALAKMALGRHPLAWVFENRLDCLFVNAFLRGWRGTRSPTVVLKHAAVIRRLRIALCASVFLTELLFCFVLLDRNLAMLLFALAALFHMGVWRWTGLTGVEYLINHVLMITVLSTWTLHRDVCFGLPPFVTLAFVLILNWVWVGTNRLQMFREFQEAGESRRLFWSDPVDHLMAWWDSPWMRMFCYEVIATSGKRYSFPVPKFAPYDTALTDIHTHMMILNQHRGFDLQRVSGRPEVATGVWGLVVDNSLRERLYRLMDDSADLESTLNRAESTKTWSATFSDAPCSEAKALVAFFAGLNHFRRHTWFRFLMRYPHFPGEDLAPDRCPIAKLAEPSYAFDERIDRVEIHRVKTFYDGQCVRLLEQSLVGAIELGTGKAN